MQNVEKRLKLKPKIGKNTFIAKNAVILGDVTIGDNVSIWYNVVIRGDVNYIIIGKDSNIQDGTIIHVTKDKFPTEIGERVTIAHSVTLHGCKIEDDCLIGIGAVVMDNSVISKNSIVAAGAVVPPNKRYPENSLIVGNPAKVARELTEKDFEMIRSNAERYLSYKDIYIKLNIS